MKLPETLKITPYVYRVVPVTKLCSADHRRMYGQCDTENLEIRVDDANNEQHMRQTLLHEVLHAISNHGNLGIDEDTTERLANGMLAFLSDNGWLRGPE
jgi:Zn-dependent peptidase ImmA (M78 family)